MKFILKNKTDNDQVLINNWTKKNDRKSWKEASVKRSD